MTTKLPMLGLRGVVILPWQTVPLFVGREKSVNTIQHANSTKQELLCLGQRHPENPSPNDVNDFFEIGCVCRIDQVVVSPGNPQIKVILEGLRPARILSLDYMSEISLAVVEDLLQPSGESDVQSDEILDLAIEHENSKTYLSMLSRAKETLDNAVTFSPYDRCLLSNFADQGDTSGLLRQFVTLSTIDSELRQRLLETPGEKQRLAMAREIVVADVQHNSRKIAELEKELGITNNRSRR
jgi:ATP-dependent Lon protease